MVFAALKRALQSLRSKTSSRYVGSDLQGNKFYEAANPAEAFGRTKRSVVYHGKDTMWDYVGGNKRLPAQWAAWMSHTRKHAPTLEELQRDHTRLQQLAQNVARIEARDHAERQERLAGRTLEYRPPVAAPTPLPDMIQADDHQTNVRPDLGPRTIDPNLAPEEDPWAKLPDVGAYQADSWSPKQPIRRGE